MPSVTLTRAGRTWPAYTLEQLNTLLAAGWAPQTGTAAAARATLTPATPSGGTGSNPPVVLAGNNPNTARPTSSGPVIWLCTDQPTNSDPIQDYWMPITGS